MLPRYGTFSANGDEDNPDEERSCWTFLMSLNQNFFRFMKFLSCFLIGRYVTAQLEDTFSSHQVIHPISHPIGPMIYTGNITELAPVNQTLSYMKRHVENGTIDACQMPEVNSTCRNNLGYSKDRCPQVKDKVREKYLSHKKTKHIVKEARHFLMIQKEADARKIIFLVENAHRFNPCTKDILVSLWNETMWCVDGAHHLMACDITGGEQHAIGVEEPVPQILSDLTQVDGVTYGDLEDHDEEKPSLRR